MMSEALTLQNIEIDVQVASREEVFTIIAKKAVENGYATDQGAVVAGLKSRELESTTGMMDGFGIPHTKSAAIQTPGIIILRLTQGVEWASLDGQPVSFVISLLIPDGEAGTTHLQLLSKVARLLMHEDVRDALKSAPTPEQILEILHNKLEG